MGKTATRPNRTEKLETSASFAPCRGWQICYTDPGLAPWAILFRPPGFGNTFWLRLRRFVGQPILAAAGFQPALAGCGASLSARTLRHHSQGVHALPCATLVVETIWRIMILLTPTCGRVLPF